ncbi:uncharacterized protein [Anabrus simplex]|uniref:uncharacterized protein n=1 Tax=Anabrus simplex TaxID=316456 RepID=UPI0035A34704
MVSSRTVFWLLLASLLVLQVLAEVRSPAEDEHALDRLKRSTQATSPIGNSPGNSHGNNSHGKPQGNGNSHGRNSAKKSVHKSKETKKLKPKSKFGKRSSAERSRRNMKDKSYRQPKLH